MQLRTLSCFLSVLFIFSVAVVADEPAKTALDEYVAKPDPSYRWELVETVEGPGHTTFVVDLTSQTWRTKDDVDRTVWKHWLVIVKPTTLKTKTGLLFIGGGSNRDQPPKRANSQITALALSTGSVVAELQMVPNQPIEFRGDGKGRYEDDLLAYTWDKYMTTGDPTWIGRLPMVKSAVRAMDTVQSLMAGPDGGQIEVDKFVVAGASKRGWTTWLTGAVDRRVVAIIPIVIDILNVRVSMKHHHAAYGFWAPAVGDYVRHGITQREDSPEYAALLKIEDPLQYRDRLRMPKFIVNAAGDQFFPPDSSQFYFSELPGEKHLRYVPNTDHSLRNSDAFESILAFYGAFLAGTPRPEFTWKYGPDGTIRVKTKDKPIEVLLWQATNPDARDFRLQTLGPAYKSAPLEDRGDGRYVARVAAPKKGWTAFFVELTFDGTPKPLKFTTSVYVTPDVLPHKDKPLSGNHGSSR